MAFPLRLPAPRRWLGAWRVLAAGVFTHHRTIRLIDVQAIPRATLAVGLRQIVSNKKPDTMAGFYFVASLTYMRKYDRMAKYSLILSLYAMAICYAAQLSIRPSASMISWAAVSASLT